MKQDSQTLGDSKRLEPNSRAAGEDRQPVSVLGEESQGL